MTSRPALLAALLGILLLAPPADAKRGPIAARPLEDDGCACFEGEMWGNDPSVVTTLELCRTGTDITGTVDWFSARSGHSVRTVSGTMTGRDVSLFDEGFVVSKPNPGWHFCTIEKYSLRFDAAKGVLDGSYVSKACRDRAKLRLRLTKPERCELEQNPELPERTGV